MVNVGMLQGFEVSQMQSTDMNLMTGHQCLSFVIIVFTGETGRNRRPLTSSEKKDFFYSCVQ